MARSAPRRTLGHVAPLLTDAAAGDLPDPADVELLDAPPAAPVAAAVRSERRSLWSRVRLATLLVAVLAVGVAAGVRADSWVRDRQARAEMDREARVEIADVTLRLSSFQLSAVEVALRNDGRRDLVLQQLTGEGGAVRPRPGVLPLTLPSGRVVSLRLRFGDRCARGGTEDAGRFTAVVRTRAGTVRTLSLDVVGDDTEVQYVAQTVRAACR